MPPRKPPSDAERPAPKAGGGPAKSRPDAGVATPVVGAASVAGSAFDVFVQRGLHQIYDRVLNEPIPEDLLKLIDDARRK